MSASSACFEVRVCFFATVLAVPFAAFADVLGRLGGAGGAASTFAAAGGGAAATGGATVTLVLGSLALGAAALGAM